MKAENDSTEPRVAALILASGASSRMGTAKALLDFDGRPCLALVLAACAGGGVRRAVVVTAPGEAGERVRARLPPWAAPVVNPRPERGMLSSLQAGLRALSGDEDAFLIFPVDFPLVRADDVRPLVAAFAARAAGSRIFVPSHARRRGHPVLVEAALAAELLALAEGETARTVMAAHAGATVFLDASDRVLADMDTPEDYRRCLERFRSGQPVV